MADYEQIYQQLQSGEKSPADFKTAFLFEVASYFAVKGDYPKKAQIYNDWIWNHPRVTEGDKVRVSTYQHDLLRRGGDPTSALKGLLALQPPADVMAKAEMWQAIGQCHLMLGDLGAALETQKQIVSLFSGGQIPADKRLYYLETLMAMKLKANELDCELEKLFESYENLLRESFFDGPAKRRALAMLQDLRGTAEIRKGNFAAAARHYQMCLEVAPAVRNQVVAALQLLYCRWQLDPEDDSSPVLGATVFFREHHRELQATDAAALQAEYDFVVQKLGIK